MMILKLTKIEVKKVLNTSYKEYIIYALDLVNFKDKERKVIELVDLRGLSQEMAADEMECSLKSINNFRKNAYLKMSECWGDNEVIRTILKGD